MLDDKGRPLGGKWTYDTENRKRLPKGISVPALKAHIERSSVTEAKRYVAKEFPIALKTVDAFCYPVTHERASIWLDAFIDERLASFGDFEDAISKQETFLFHSVLTPMINIGLLTPEQIIQRVVSKSDEVSLNSLEGFLRQVVGWREFIRLVYIHSGSRHTRHLCLGHRR